MIEFSHPYFSSGLRHRSARRPGRPAATGSKTARRRCFRWHRQDYERPLGLLLVAAVLVWLSERRANPNHFSPQPLRGIADGLWWAAVTLTTVGYGDKAPRTRAGRSVGMIWMFAAVILIALFTAQVTSSLTVTRLTGRVRGPADLVHVKVGAIRNSPARAILRTKFGVSAQGCPELARVSRRSTVARSMPSWVPNRSCGMKWQTPFPGACHCWYALHAR